MNLRRVLWSWEGRYFKKFCGFFGCIVFRNANRIYVFNACLNAVQN
jgi:hypothetical protein